MQEPPQGEVTAHVFWKNKKNPPALLVGPQVPGTGRHMRIFSLSMDAVSVNTRRSDNGANARRRFNSGRGHEKGTRVSKLILRYSPRPFFLKGAAKN